MRSFRTDSTMALWSVYALVAGAVAAGLIVWTEIEGQAAVRAVLRTARPWLFLWRVFLLSVLMLGWHPIVTAIAGHFRLSPGSARALHEWRWRAGALLVLMDLILVEDLPSRLTRHL